MAFKELFFDITFKCKWIEKIIFIFISVYFVAFAAGRYGVGKDFSSYEYHYYAINEGVINFLNFSVEPLFSLLNIISPSFISLLVICSIISYCFRLSIVNKKYLYTYLFFYYASDYIFYDMGLIRQGISIAICLYSINAIKRQSKIFFINIFFAMMFHVSAVLFIPLYYIGNKEYSRKVYYISLFVIIVLSFVVSFAFEYIYYFFRVIGLEFIAYKFSKFYDYGTIYYYGPVIKRTMMTIFFIEIFKRKKMNIFGILFPRRMVSNDIWLYINGFYISVLYFILFSTSFMNVAGRMTAALYSLYILIYVEILKDKRCKFINILYFIAFAIMSYFTMSFTLDSVDGGTYLPYNNVFIDY